MGGKQPFAASYRKVRIRPSADKSTGVWVSPSSSRFWKIIHSDNQICDLLMIGYQARVDDFEHIS